MTQTVIWDWNGTLLNDVEANFRIVNELLHRRSLAPIDLDTYRARFRMPIQCFYEEIGFLFTSERFEDIAGEYFTLYNKAFPDIALSQGAISILTWLQELGVHQYIVSATEQTELRKQVEQKGISAFFAGIIGNDDHSVVSKELKAKNLIASLDDPGKLLVVGDLEHDYEVAKAIGAACLIYAKGHQKTGAKNGRVTINALDEVIHFI